MNEKSRTDHRERAAYVYVRQSSLQHVRQHRESQQRQDGLADRARPLGCNRVVVIDVVTALTVTNQDGSPHARGDDARPHGASTAATEADIRPTRPVADASRSGATPMPGTGGTTAARGASGRGSDKERG